MATISPLQELTRLYPPIYPLTLVDYGGPFGPATDMASTRAPLRDAPSAVVNSPMGRASTATVGVKRARPDGTGKQLSGASNAENAMRGLYNTSAVAGVKRSFVETDAASSLNGLPRRSAQQPTTALQRKLEESRARAPTAHNLGYSNATAKKGGDVTTDHIKQWQKHYRRVFPSFVFYFDNIPEELKYKLVSQIKQLGARDEPFFSKNITNVVTSRPIPTDATAKNANISPNKTINPAMLQNQRGRSTLTGDNGKRAQPSTNDILFKAKEMNMKIWTVEKMQRILNALSSMEETLDTKIAIKDKASHPAELSRLLKADKRLATSDKGWMSEMLQFRGYYVYVRDMDERSKPLMIRDYPKTAPKEQGKWPQLRVNMPGRCPFVDDGTRRTVTEPSRKVSTDASRRRAVTAGTAVQPEKTAQKSVLEEKHNTTVREVEEEPKEGQSRKTSNDHLPLFGSAQASLRRIPRFVQGEPIASGVQPSNITSAVRSQAISSAAAVPGAKAGASRELNALKRKMYEKSGAASGAAYLTKMRAALNEDETTHGVKRKALGNIVEENDAPRPAQARKKRVIEKEPKPGYCENCRDKYEDFDEHVGSLRHTRFAVDDKNFRELDDLLAKLERV